MTEVNKTKSKNPVKLWQAILIVIFCGTPAQAADGLVLVPEGPVLVVLVLAFAALVFPVNALIFKPLFRVLDEREARIEGARARAAEVQVEADALLERYREAIREVREEAERDRRGELEAARREHGSRSDQARADAQGVLEQGRSELDVWLGEARGELRQSAEPLAQLAAERVLGRGLS